MRAFVLVSRCLLAILVLVHGAAGQSRCGESPNVVAVRTSASDPAHCPAQHQSGPQPTSQTPCPIMPGCLPVALPAPVQHSLSAVAQAATPLLDFDLRPSLDAPAPDSPPPRA